MSEEVENSQSPRKVEGGDGQVLTQKDLRKIKQMLKDGKMSKQQQAVIERLLFTLTAEQEMRFKSEQQHSKVVDNLVHNQVMMEEQVKMHRERSVMKGDLGTSIGVT